MAPCRVKNYSVIKADIMKAEPERSSQRLSSDSDSPARGEEALQDTTEAKCPIGVYEAYHHALHGERAQMCRVGVKAHAWCCRAPWALCWLVPGHVVPSSPRSSTSKGCKAGHWGSVISGSHTVYMTLNYTALKIKMTPGLISTVINHCGEFMPWEWSPRRATTQPRLSEAAKCSQEGSFLRGVHDTLQTQSFTASQVT